MRELCFNEMQAVSGGDYFLGQYAAMVVMVGFTGLMTGGAAYVLGGAFSAGASYGSLAAAFVLPELMI